MLIGLFIIGQYILLRKNILSRELIDLKITGQIHDQIRNVYGFSISTEQQAKKAGNCSRLRKLLLIYETWSKLKTGATQNQMKPLKNEIILSKY